MTNQQTNNRYNHHSTNAATATARKTKLQSHKTIQTQTFNILQNVFECGVAGICKDRNLFPNYFFQDYETNDDHLLVTNFDMNVLLNNDLSSTSSSSRDSGSSSSSSTSHAKQKNRDGDTVNRSSSDLNELGQESNLNQIRSKSCNSSIRNSSSSSNSSGNGDIVYLDNNATSMSPLTSSIMPTGSFELTPSSAMNSINDNPSGSSHTNNDRQYNHHHFSQIKDKSSVGCHYQYDHNQCHCHKLIV